MFPAKLPPLPLLTGDQLIENFSHRLLRRGLEADNKALIDQGKAALEFAVTSYLISKKPIVTADEISSFRSSILSEGNFNAWVIYYGLHEILSNNCLKAPSADNIFYAYVGAVQEQAGVESATEWIVELVSSIDHGLEITNGDTQPHSGPEPIQAPNETHDTGAATLPPELVTIEIFHNLCTQGHLRVEYQCANHASAHAPLWIVKCLVNGIEKGKGRGATKKIAKEAAVKQAYTSMI